LLARVQRDFDGVKIVRIARLSLGGQVGKRRRAARQQAWDEQNR
jgi:hypothetical protein